MKTRTRISGVTGAKLPKTYEKPEAGQLLEFGMATGLVATPRVNLASPVGDFAHIHDLDWKNELCVRPHTFYAF